MPRDTEEGYVGPGTPEYAGNHGWNTGDTGDGAPDKPDVEDILDDAGDGSGGTGGGGGGGGGTTDPHISQLSSAYYTLWGLMPPPGYVEKNASLNVYEFIEQERQKPAFMQSKTAEQEFAGFASQLARLLGTR